LPTVTEFIDLMAGHLGSFGRALAARARRRRLGNQGAFDEAADRLGSAGTVGLPFGPCVNALFKRAKKPMPATHEPSACLARASQASAST
jgi:hypothetical protein